MNPLNRPNPRDRRPLSAALPRLGLSALFAFLAALPLSGCYQRVVSAKGLGADRYNVSEPYQESGKVDEWIFGSPGPKAGRLNNTKLPSPNP